MLDKEKERKDILKKIDNFCTSIDGECETKCSNCIANFLASEGYGNIKQALTEFAERLKDKNKGYILASIENGKTKPFRTEIDETLKEF